MADVFISYARGERALTESLAAELTSRGFSIWWDTSLIFGEEFRHVIVNELTKSKAVIVIWSKTSVTSDWVYSEARRARLQNKLIPLRSVDINADDIPPPFDALHTGPLEDVEKICIALDKLNVRPTIRSQSAFNKPTKHSKSAEELMLDFTDFFSQQKGLPPEDQASFHAIINRLKTLATEPHLPNVIPTDSRSQLALGGDSDVLTLETTKGRVVIALRPDLAPKHVERIKTLVGEGFYDGIVFHRVIDGFMAQTGCPLGTGTGGSNYPNLPAEFNSEPHVRGTVSMARAQNPNSANSQFFICFDDARFLDKQYTVWGKVIEGMDNVDKIKKGEPVSNPDKIVKATIG